MKDMQTSIHKLVYLASCGFWSRRMFLEEHLLLVRRCRPREIHDASVSLAP